MKDFEIFTRLVCFNVYMFNTFQGLELRVSWCKFNLNIWCLLLMFIVWIIEQTLQYLCFLILKSLVQCLYGYFSHNLKRQLEFIWVINIMETKNNENLHNIKTRWIFLLAFMICVLFEYCILFMKMTLNVPIIMIPQFNLYLLTIVKT